MNELNMYRLELRDIYYEPCPGMNLIVTASRTFQKNQIIFSLICSEFAYFHPQLNTQHTVLLKVKNYWVNF